MAKSMYKYLWVPDLLTINGRNYIDFRHQAQEALNITINQLSK